MLRCVSVRASARVRSWTAPIPMVPTRTRTGWHTVALTTAVASEYCRFRNTQIDRHFKSYAYISHHPHYLSRHASSMKPSTSYETSHRLSPLPSHTIVAWIVLSLSITPTLLRWLFFYSLWKCKTPSFFLNAISVLSFYWTPTRPRARPLRNSIR